MKTLGPLTIILSCVWGLSVAFGGEPAHTGLSLPDDAVAKAKKHRDGGSKDDEEHEEEFAPSPPVEFDVLARR